MNMNEQILKENEHDSFLTEKPFKLADQQYVKEMLLKVTKQNDDSLEKESCKT